MGEGEGVTGGRNHSYLGQCGLDLVGLHMWLRLETGLVCGQTEAAGNSQQRAEPTPGGAQITPRHIDGCPPLSRGVGALGPRAQSRLGSGIVQGACS